MAFPQHNPIEKKNGVFILPRGGFELKNLILPRRNHKFTHGKINGVDLFNMNNLDQ